MCCFQHWRCVWGPAGPSGCSVIGLKVYSQWSGFYSSTILSICVGYLFHDFIIGRRPCLDFLECANVGSFLSCKPCLQLARPRPFKPHIQQTNTTLTLFFNDSYCIFLVFFVLFTHDQISDIDPSNALKIFLGDVFIL